MVAVAVGIAVAIVAAAIVGEQKNPAVALVGLESMA